MDSSYDVEKDWWPKTVLGFGKFIFIFVDVFHPQEIIFRLLCV
jgi:hypothetical protein